VAFLLKDSSYFVAFSPTEVGRDVSGCRRLRSTPEGHFEV